MKPARRPVSSTWCWAAAWSAMPCPSIPTSTAFPSPVRRPWAPRSPWRRCRTSRACRWKWAARIRWWCWTMPNSTAPCRSRWTAAISPPASAAPPPSRVFVQAGIYDKFVAAVAERAKALKVGNALDPATQMGPAVTDVQLQGQPELCRHRHEGRRPPAGRRRRAAEAGDARPLHEPDPDRGHQARRLASTRKKCSAPSCRW